jgi:hypothetical protein
MAFDKTPTELFPNASNGANTLILKTSNAPDIPAVARVQTVLCVADVEESLSGTFFDIADEDGPVRVWLDVDGVSAPPEAPTGGRLLEVDIVEDDSAATVAGKVQTAIHADSKFTATVDTATVTVTNVYAGALADGVDSGDSGFTVTITTPGTDAVPQASVPELTDAEANVTTGDSRKIAFAICERFVEWYNSLDTDDRPTMLIFDKQAQQISGSNQQIQTFIFQFTSDTSSEVADEPA